MGVEAPMQIRIAANLERLDTRVRGVGAAFRKLIDKGHTYVIESEGHHYPIIHTAVVDAMMDASVKRRLQKAAPPKLL